MSKSVPFSLRLALAMATGNQEAVEKVVTDFFGNMTHRLMAMVQSYGRTDLMFAVATMKITARSLENILDENEKNFVKQIESHTACVAVNLDEMRRQANESGDDMPEWEI